MVKDWFERKSHGLVLDHTSRAYPVFQTVAAEISRDLIEFDWLGWLFAFCNGKDKFNTAYISCWNKLKTRRLKWKSWAGVNDYARVWPLLCLKVPILYFSFVFLFCWRGVLTPLRNIFQRHMKLCKTGITPSVHPYPLKTPGPSHTFIHKT